MDKQFLESSEFYSARFHNFSTLIIVPITLMLLGVVIFSLFGKREITINGTGTLEAVGITPIIQSTSNSSIKKSYLEEGKYVHKGEILLVYSNVVNNNKLKLYRKQKENLKKQLDSLNLLKQGVFLNKDVFTKNDSFGYHDLLKSYLNQRNIYSTENQMLSQKSENNQSKEAALTKIEQTVVDRDKNNIQAYQALYNSIKNDTTYSNNAKYSYLYQEYKTKLSSISSSSDKDSLKDEYLSEVQQQIDSLNDSLSTAKIQVEELQDFDDSSYSISVNNQKLKTLQSDQLNKVAEDLSKVKQDLQQLKTNMINLNNSKKEYTIRASKSGVLHIDNEYVGKKYISAGTEIAQIYPILRKQKNLKLVAYVSAADISSVKTGQIMRYKVTRNVPEPIIISGIIKKISVSPINVGKGNYYVVTAIAKAESSEKNLLKYGMTGTSSIITGKKTFFNYYKDKLLGRND